MINKFIITIMLSMSFMLPLISNAEENHTSKKNLKILFIGNSYTKHTRRYFTGLAKAGQPDTQIDWITPGGRQLSQHAENEKVIEQIEKNKYDIVILQDQSQTPSFPDYLDKHLPAIKKLHDAIQKSGAKTILYMTWGRKIGDVENEKTFPNDSYEKMQKRLTAGYEALAEKLDAKIAPVGLVWAKLVDKMELYREDGSHPNSNGGYLAACVLYYTIFEASPEQLSYTGDVQSDKAKLIRETVAGYFKKN